MFDFTPVGLACAVAGVLFVATVGWRLIPRREAADRPGEPLLGLVDYVAEMRVGGKSLLVGTTVAKLAGEAAEDVGVLGALRHGRRLPVTAPLAERGLEPVRRERAGIAAGSFALAILAASFGLVGLPVALGLVALLLVRCDIVPLRQLYDSIEWPVIVLLGSMIPLGEALQGTGGTALVAGALVSVTGGLAPVWVLLALMLVTMTLSDVMNNTATAVIAAPVAIEVAHRLGVSPDPFLMGVAVAASCAFLTPIGHKNNTLVLGPGGYRFGDYWRMGLPLELLILLVAVPTIVVVWPS